MRALIAAAVLSSVAIAGQRDVDTPDADYIARGQRYARLCCEISGEESHGIRAKGSAVLIGSRWVCTAAHVTADMRRDIRVRWRDESSRLVKRVCQHPRFRQECVGEHDIALVQLDREVDAVSLPAIADAIAGETVNVVGFGMTGPMGAERLEYDGGLRAGCVTLDHANRTCLVAFARRGAATPLMLIASGDSGGPMFSAAGELVGIHSYTARPAGVRRGQYGEESCHTRIWLYRDWIAQTMEAHK